MKTVLRFGPLLGLLLAPVSLADDIGDLLNKIPTIEQKAPEPAEEEAPAEVDSLAEDGLEVYSERCRSHVLAGFKAPGSAARKNPEIQARVVVKLHGDGSYMGLSMTESSGDKGFDKAVIKALQAAEPLPKPPVTLRNEVARGISVVFTAK